jgi:hypothetical protein
LTHETDEQAEPLGPPNAQRPDAMSEEKFDDQGHHRFHDRYVEGGRKRGSEMSCITITRHEPVIDVCTTESCLYGLKEKYTGHYIRAVRS